MDRRSPIGPWTFTTLRAIEARPGVLAAKLAHALGRPRDEFKRDVRKLKKLGLTSSLEIGYRLTPKGEALLRHRGFDPWPWCGCRTPWDSPFAGRRPR